MEMTPSRFALPSPTSVLPDLAAFCIGVASARLLGWTTTDLVWSLWLSSLVLGYLSILSVIGEGVTIGCMVVFNPTFPAQDRGKAILAGSGVALFLVGFFSLHFCGFHSVHAAFLSSFFPLPGAANRAVGNMGMNPFKVLGTAVHVLMPTYGIFLIPMMIAERRIAFGWIGTVAAKWNRLDPAQGLAQLFGASGASGHDLISRPYLNVVRMHLLIFFFAICHALKVDSFPVFVVVYAVYFFPWSAFRRSTGDRQATAETCRIRA